MKGRDLLENLSVDYMKIDLKEFWRKYQDRVQHRAAVHMVTSLRV
jgi:hypothetical protein